MLRKAIRLLVIPVTVVALLAFVATNWNLGGSPAVPRDLIVVLGGGAGERVITAAQLYRQGMGPLILVTGHIGFPGKMIERLELNGVPARRILVSIRPSHSTREDALAVRQMLPRVDARSLLVVTSPQHCRRARLIFGRVFADLDVRITVTPSESLYMNPDRWWETRHGWKAVPVELPKLLWAWLTTGRGGS